jgi:hypothetical protein
MDFTKREELEKAGFVLPDPQIIGLKGHRNETISFSIRTPEEGERRYSLTFQVSSLKSRENGGDVKYIGSLYIKLEEHTATDRIGDILLSPLTILLIIVISLVVIVVWLRRRG